MIFANFLTMIKISFFSFAKTSNETKLPEKDNYNRLSVENIADANYAHGKKVWNRKVL